MQYKITKVYKRFMDCYVEADSLEEALEASAADDAEWKWDNTDGEDSYMYLCSGWSLLDEEGEMLDEGDLTNEQAKPILDFVGNVTGW